MFETISEHVFPWLRTLGGNGSTYARHMKDARFTIPTPQLLAKVVDLIARVPMEDRDTKATFTNTCSARLPRQGRTASSAPRAISYA